MPIEPLVDSEFPHTSCSLTPRVADFNPFGYAVGAIPTIQTPVVLQLKFRATDLLGYLIIGEKPVHLPSPLPDH